MHFSVKEGILHLFHCQPYVVHEHSQFIPKSCFFISTLWVVCGGTVRWNSVAGTVETLWWNKFPVSHHLCPLFHHYSTNAPSALFHCSTNAVQLFHHTIPSSLFHCSTPLFPHNCSTVPSHCSTITVPLFYYTVPPSKFHCSTTVFHRDCSTVPPHCFTTLFLFSTTLFHNDCSPVPPHCSTMTVPLFHLTVPPCLFSCSTILFHHCCSTVSSHCSTINVLLFHHSVPP